MQDREMGSPVPKYSASTLVFNAGGMPKEFFLGTKKKF